MIDVDLDSLKTIEFGVGLDTEAPAFVLIPVDGDVAAALTDMVRETLLHFEERPEWRAHEPSEKYAGTEYLRAELDDSLATGIRDLHTAENLPPDSEGLAAPELVFCYFARLFDAQERHLTALRRAAQFKGLLKRPLLRRLKGSDDYGIDEEDVFKLDLDFDIVADSQTIHIWRPSGFEYVARLQREILRVVPQIFAELQVDLPYVDLSSVQEFATERSRAARLAASIRSRRRVENVDQSALAEQCERTDVRIETGSDGRLRVAEGHEFGFLEVLDRRRYNVELVAGELEAFRAASRTKIGA